MNTKNSSVLLFVIGLFSQTQIYVGGAIGLSELFVFAVAPIIFMKNQSILKREGFMKLIGLVFASLVGCVIAIYVNSTPGRDAIRGIMANYGLFASIVVFHSLLRKNLLGVRWFLLGVAISLVISTFAFQSASELYKYGEGMSGAGAVDGIMSAPLYWTARIGSFWVLPCSGWYFSTPQIWNWSSMGIWGIVSAFISKGSGRSSAITMLVSGFLILICGKTQTKMRKVSRHIGRLFILGFVFMYAITALYKFTASTGVLGEEAQQKYERQVRGAKSPLAVLMSGRSEFFVGIYACLRKPIFGYGPWPLDKEYFYENWLNKYGTGEAVDQYYEYKYNLAKQGYGDRMGLIPSHSVIVQFWLWYGIWGLILWIYVLTKIYVYFRHDMSAVPQCVGYIVGWTPMYIWNIFFSPFGGRLEYGAFLSAILLCSAVRKGVIALPHEMIIEIERHNNK